ncbi:putative phosphoenolpyruvate synthase like protein [Argiope bruennichi]|uniref:Putative phosphoenolpyruvate synthase like protein n=1 Tax=Argiope bruennichi TaxID=94029 RepID=A0A8T0FM99_ARGBR|nr:putative phosphoenolpyruvate synthase like protein [Argiope bruennichi]
MGAVLATPITVTLALLSTRPSDIIYWCKWITSYFYVSTYKRSLETRFDWFDMDADGDPYKTDFIPFPEELTLESPLPESQLVNTADEVFFYGVNSKSEYLIARIARGTNHEAQAWVYLKLSNGKIYQLQETSGFEQSSSDKRTFSCGGLQIHYLCPMRRWRIFFNGLLNETSEDGESLERKVHVKFALLWRASTDPFDFRTHVSSKALTTSLAKAKWDQYSPPIERLFNALNMYTQCGIIMGTVNIDGSDEDLDLYLFGERLRMLGDIPSLKGTESFHVLGHVPKNGRFVHIMEVSIANVAENLVFGFATSLTGGIRPIQAKDFSLESLVNEERAKKDIEAKFRTKNKLFQLKGKVSGRRNNILINESWNERLTVDCLDFELNILHAIDMVKPKGEESNLLAGGETGKGFLLNGKITNSSRKTISQKISSNSESATTPLVVHFSEKICQNSDVTGGKGSSLGKLTELSKELQSFVVPNGIVVTTRAYELFITDDILKEIKKLESVLYQDKLDETKAACQRLMDEVIKSSIPDPILQAVVTNLQNAFPDRKHDHKFAVRSSATGEDTEQMSAAGQMETFLGVAGISEIMAAIKKCWASQFSFIAVQYKRQNGQVINSPMAVVVQEMIPCDIAGVLFTCDPLTGNPTSMSVTANYGLGESVVSGSEEPDTIEIERLDENNLTIKNKIIGSKSRRIVLKDDGGTKVEDVAENEKQSCCLSDNNALRLGRIAIKIEKSYRSYRDIEWGFWNNNIYIFQSRPVTSGFGETDFEIDHEFDAAMRCENDYFTMSNVGEVMPGSTSPLGLDVIMKFFKIVFQSRRFTSWHRGEHPRYYPRGIVSMYRHVMFFCLDLFQHVNENLERAKASGVGMFGRVLDDEELFDMAKERHGDEIMKFFSRKMYVRLIYEMVYGGKSRLDKAINHYGKYSVPSIKYKNSQELFNHLLSCCSDLTPAMRSHMVCSQSSSFLNMFIFMTLKNAIGEINADVYSDFSQLLTTSSEVESADVPAAMEKLAYFIFKEKKPEEFKSMKTEEALRWLETTQTTAGEKYRDFLEKHGHRCLREFDVFSLTWKQDPQTLVKLLQNLVGSVTKEKSEKKQEDFGKLISKLKAPMTRSTKLLLRILLPLSRKAVQHRECSKSLLIRSVNEWRKGYRKLAKLMVQEGRFPDEDILFFMSLEEIKERRRQPVIDRYIFPEIIKGFPKPINAENKIAVNNDENFSMKGLPVSRGVATGVVRVALDLEEASLLQPGEILVTYSTDIGWSPYFPILGGVVTELGGLISHGAVVSREYGLPCIAGMHGATQQFKTGDYVLLDGTKGILQRLPKPEDS